MPQNEHRHENERGPDVSITINSTVYMIHRGRQTVTALKQTGSVPAAEELEQVIAGVFTPLADDGAVTIHGAEVFISHTRASGSS